jgi:hypothetical protein
MTGDEELTIVLADASVVVNLAIVDRVELLAALRDQWPFALQPGEASPFPSN